MTADQADGTDALLKIEGLKVHFRSDAGMVQAVDGVDISIAKRETVGIVGESGCGKTVTAMTTMKLIPMPPGEIVAGQIRWQGRDLVTTSEDEMRKIRAKEIAIVFQEPMTSLNPVYSIGEQIAEVLRLHERLSRKDAIDRTIEMLDLVRIPSPERRVHDYPHQFSGGMRQRVAIAIALLHGTRVIVADEPTTALDVSIQAQILSEMRELAREMGTALVWISHDLSTVSALADRILVMYAGRIVEEGPTAQVLRSPRHPYTAGLLRSLPAMAEPGTDLEQIPGTTPSLLNLPQGCPFRPRCDRATDLCSEAPRMTLETGRGYRCHHPLLDGTPA